MLPWDGATLRVERETVTEHLTVSYPVPLEPAAPFPKTSPAALAAKQFKRSRR